MGRVLVGMFLGVLLVPGLAIVWFQYGNPPVAVADPPFYKEELFTKTPLRYRIEREAPKFAPITPSEDNLVAGARIYHDQCALCHGVYGAPSQLGARMYPMAPPLWAAHRVQDTVGVSGDPVGETYWKVANGIRLTGMPAFRGVLNETGLWQVSLLLANANKPLPPAALDLVRGPGRTGLQPAQGAGAPKP